MGRVREDIEIDGRRCRALFDTGARNTYVVPEVAALLVTADLDVPLRPALGGSIKEARRTAILNANVEGCRISTLAMVIDRIGEDEDGKSIDILFGALAMQQWGIRPVPDEEKLDMSRYPKELLEF